MDTSILAPIFKFVASWGSRQLLKVGTVAGSAVSAWLLANSDKLSVDPGAAADLAQKSGDATITAVTVIGTLVLGAIEVFLSKKADKAKEAK